MFIKLMDCLPIKRKEKQFAKAQEAWQEMSHCDGLRGQFGGWDNLSSRAFIFALWEDQASIGFIRMADCVLFPDGHEQLLVDQTAVWNPGMSSCKGMLGGFIGKFSEEADRYLVISFWETEADHNSYINHTFPTLRNKVNIYAYIKNLEGHQIVINKNWNVFPTPHKSDNSNELNPGTG